MPFAPPDDYLRYSFCLTCGYSIPVLPLLPSSSPASFLILLFVSMHSIHTYHVSARLSLTIIFPLPSSRPCCAATHAVSYEDGAVRALVLYNAYPLIRTLPRCRPYCYYYYNAVSRYADRSDPARPWSNAKITTTSPATCSISEDCATTVSHTSSLLVSVSRSRAHRTREFEVIHGSGITQDYGYVR